jgi:hypothetical protein
MRTHEQMVRASILPEKEFDRWATGVTDCYEGPAAFVLRLEERIRELLIEELRPIFEAAARADQPLVEYHGRRLRTELVPLHGMTTGGGEGRE